MKWLAKLEYRYGRHAPKNLMLVVAGGKIIAWLVVMLLYYQLYGWLLLTRNELLRGEVWRLVTFVFTPNFTTNPLFFALEVYLIYWVGTSLERAWGAFTFDVYFLLGMAGAWVACLLTGWGSSLPLFYSIFFAFAWLFPNVELLFFFVLPVKVKWLGLAAAALYLYDMAELVFYGQYGQVLAMLLGFANFFIFFGPDAFHRIKTRAEARRRRREWENQWRGR